MQKTNCFKLQPIYDKKVFKLMKDTKKELDAFFGVDYRLPKVFFIESRSDFDAVCGRKTEDWVVGHTNDGVFFITHPEVYTKISNHKNQSGWIKTFRHEMNHIWYDRLMGSPFPFWLAEGLAMYFAGQKPYKAGIDTLLKIVKIEKEKEWRTLLYKLGGYWVYFLIDNFGKEKMMRLLKEIRKDKTMKNLKDSFYKIYKYKFTKTDLKKLIEKYNKNQT